MRGVDRAVVGVVGVGVGVGGGVVVVVMGMLVVAVLAGLASTSI
jgi:hypothetical protein